MNPARDGTGRRGGRSELARTLALGAGAIALFTIGVVGVIWAMGDPKEQLPAGGGPQQAVAEPARTTASPRPLALPVTTAPSVSAPAPPPPLPEEVDPTWRDVPIVFRNRDEMGRVGPYVLAGLRHAQEAMRPCWEGSKATRGESAAEAPGPPAVLLLYLVAREGAIDIVDVTTDDLGSSTTEVVECCRSVLRGHEIRAPNAQPGWRFRLKYAL